jgi:HTH-type transcriptional regulator/antitoxin HigA
MGNSAAFQPRWASAPGETISDCLRRRSLSLPAFAERMGSSSQAVTHLLNGETEIDRELAERLHRIIGGSARFWLDRDAQYRNDLRRLTVARDREAARQWLRELPVRDMIECGWIQPTNDRSELAVECLRFFNVPSVDGWHRRYKVIAEAVAFRTSGAFDSRPGAVVAWLRRGEIEATAIECKPWHSGKFRRTLQEIRALTRQKQPAFFVPKLQQLCAECGVAVVVARAPKGCRASGATRFISPTQALLLLSFRYRSDDHFWFTFFHEAGHLLLHDRRALFVEGTDVLSTHEEEEANEFSANTLVPASYREEMTRLARNYKSVIRLAHRVGVSPGIIVGQLQHHGQLARNQMNFLKRRFVWRHDQWHAIRGMG